MPNENVNELTMSEDDFKEACKNFVILFKQQVARLKANHSSSGAVDNTQNTNQNEQNKKKEEGFSKEFLKSLNKYSYHQLFTCLENAITQSFTELKYKEKINNNNNNEKVNIEEFVKNDGLDSKIKISYSNNDEGKSCSTLRFFICQNSHIAEVFRILNIKLVKKFNELKEENKKLEEANKKLNEKIKKSQKEEELPELLKDIKDGALKDLNKYTVNEAGKSQSVDSNSSNSKNQLLDSNTPAKTFENIKNLKGKSDRNAIHYCVESNRTQSLQSIFNNIEGLFGKNTSAQNAKTEGFKKLLDTPDADGYTPVQLAAMKGHVDILKMLIKRGANVNYKARCEEKSEDISSDLSAFEIAVKKNQPGCAALLAEQLKLDIEALSNTNIDSQSNENSSTNSSQNNNDILLDNFKNGLKLAINFGYKAIFDKLHNNEVICPKYSESLFEEKENLIAYAIKYQKWSIAQELMKRGYKYDAKLVDNEQKGGSTSVAKEKKELLDLHNSIQKKQGINYLKFTMFAILCTLVAAMIIPKSRNFIYESCAAIPDFINNANEYRIEVAKILLDSKSVQAGADIQLN